MSSSDFINSVIDAHGGLARYQALTSITTRVQFSGGLLAIKRPKQLFQVTATVSTREQKTVYRGLSSTADEEWVFTPKRVWKQSISTGKVLDAREHPRAAFKDHDLRTPWDDFHLMYFTGYALWQYFNFPYLLARNDVKARELDPHLESGHKWRVLQVDYPEALHVHCAQQKYYFDQNLALRRHDYTVDVTGGGAGGHYSFDDIEVGGLRFHGLRRVVSRRPVEGSIGASSEPQHFGPLPTLILLVFKSYHLHREDGREEGSWEIGEVVPE